MTLHEIVSRFQTTPFLFVGSGISRRYYDLPDWQSLLLHFAKRIKGEDELAFRYYENQLPAETQKEDRMPMIASLIEKDFNELWFSERENAKSTVNTVSERVLEGVTPFKAEMAEYLRSISIQNKNYISEIEKLKKLTKSNLSGIITTNYDDFFESICDDYKVFVGQDELVFSQIQGIAEIYKIHGSVDDPESIVIDHDDYINFREKGKYLAAKLMTIFMEYPIVFMGYSLSDPDVLSIIEDIVTCLPESKIESLEKRFIFVEYDEGRDGIEIASHTILVNGKLVSMTKVVLENFEILYDALSLKKAALPVKVLRRFKDDLYSFVMTSEQKTTMRVAALDDSRIDEDTLALTIGGLEATGRLGLAPAVDGDQWYRNIIVHDIEFSADDLLELTFPEISRQNSWKLPVWYYVRNAKNPEHCKLAIERGAKSYDEIVTIKDIERNQSTIHDRSLADIWDEEHNNLKKAMRLMCALPKEKVLLDRLEAILVNLFEQDRNILSSLDSNGRSSLRKMIRIYDFLKYKTP